MAHKACTPWGETSYVECGDFKKCYSYNGEYADSNSTLDKLYSLHGGLCDCHATYGYGKFPNCDSLSSATFPILVSLVIVPSFVVIVLFYIVVSAGRQDVVSEKVTSKGTGRMPKKRRKNVMVKRGGYAVVVSSIAYMILMIVTAFSILEPFFFDKNIVLNFVFRIALSLTVFFTIPALFVVPICWVETIKASRKMNQKTKGEIHLKSKRFLVSVQVVSCFFVGVASGIGWYKAVNLMVTCLMFLTCILHVWAKNMMIKAAHDVISHGHQAMLEIVCNRLWVICFFNALFAFGYSTTVDKRDYGNFRLNPTFLGCNFVTIVLAQINTARYLRYLLRNNIRPNFFLFEARLWKHLEDITIKEDSKKVSFDVEVVEVEGATGKIKSHRRLSRMGKVSGTRCRPSFQSGMSSNMSTVSMSSSASDSTPHSTPPSSPGEREVKNQSLKSRVRAKIKAITAQKEIPRLSDGTEEVYQDWKSKMRKEDANGNGNDNDDDVVVQMTSNPINQSQERRSLFTARASSLSSTKGRSTTTSSFEPSSMSMSIGKINEEGEEEEEEDEDD
eukprot:CAMPEP_0118634590 /NCGR_PEP_ID=MMETSP0785-20121206/1627_1 /TAXON_ID=91992 /ORGANISM="Bolidomonas pacifica, Strain CCMP 1866" /LENGTH=558 /DNA_ID=CAMNT_0006525573 /DNA_START=122 /DNA_END=1795 /DNA_ORIENTATION=-